MTEKKRILHLTVKKKWFDEIADEKKKTEYREDKSYWEKRLFNYPAPYGPFSIDKKFDEVWFRNGYSKKSPFLRIEFIRTGYELTPDEFIEDLGGPCFAIHLGKILEVRR